MAHPDINDLIARARAIVDAMSPAEHAAMFAKQRRSYVIAEMGMGSDADEAEYCRALAADDADTLARLDQEAEQRMGRARAYLDGLPS